MATRAILVNFHKYTPYGGEFYEPILDFFLNSMRKYASEYDMLYLLDSNWNINPQKLEGMKAKIVKTDPNMRYYDCFKVVLPQIEEDLVLLLDDDLVVYKSHVIEGVFQIVEKNPNLPKSWTGDVATIIDTIGEYKTDKLKRGNKFCPYWFATSKDLLLKYIDVSWAPDMPYCETLGHLTEKMLDDDIKCQEIGDDKSNILFDGTQDGEHSKNIGIYHIRAGSTPSYLLATRYYGEKKTYDDYIKNQPRNEYLRQFAWYTYMLQIVNGDDGRGWNFDILMEDLNISTKEWMGYMDKFRKYHRLL